MCMPFDQASLFLEILGNSHKHIQYKDLHIWIIFEVTYNNEKLETILITKNRILIK